MDDETQAFAATMLVVVYFLPSVVAFWRRPDGWAGTCFFNLMFGWSGIGWVLAYFAACGPTAEEVAYRDKVRLARDQFYLREQEKAKQL